MNKSKVAIAVSKLVGTIQLFWGIFLLLTFGLCTIMYLSDIEFRLDVGAGFLIFCLVLDFIGIMLIVFSRKTKKLISEFKKYVSVISLEQVESIDDLASTIGTTPYRVKKNLELMIKRNYFVNAYVNYETNTIVIANASGAGINKTLGNVEYSLCNCRNCGASNKVVKGKSGECDYCGTPIKG